MKKNIFAFFALIVFVSVSADTLRAQGNASGCPVVGIKPEGAYYPARSRSCFANAKAAQRRGFIAASEASVIKGASFALSGAEEVPPVTTSSSGNCLVALLKDRVSLQVVCFHNIAAPTSAHVHDGESGVAGPIICGFDSPVSPISQTCTLTAAQVTKLLDGELYINVHTDANPAGEIRGQIE